MSRVIVGFLLVPIVAAGTLVCFAVFASRTPVLLLLFGDTDLVPVLDAGALFWWALLFSLPVTLVLALPAFLVLRRYRVLRLSDCIFAGAALGPVPFLLVAVPVPFLLPSAEVPARLLYLLKYGIVAAVSGVVASFAFWLLALKDNENPKLSG